MAQIIGANQSAVSRTASILNAAAAKYGISPTVLFGVWGMETDFGQDVATSSTGAVGDFQFEPATAQTYGYPQTNNPTWTQFTQQADGAAHYISDLVKSHGGDLNSALMAYSGGGYGLTQVQAKAGSGPGSNVGGVNVPGLSSINPLGSVQPNVSTPDVGGVLTGIFNSLVGDAKYAGVLVVVLVAAAFLLTRAFSGGGGEHPTVIPVPV